ncbi:MAG TPA: PfkB family carbohydrate kinase [Phycisphaerales bacterium]|nr:PfkB family carbohydrate kinase [Phycisphaerales bacterium]
MPLIVTGTIGIDTVVTPTGHADRILGGSCTYFAAAASLYAPVRIVAAVGDDFPPEHRAVFAKFPGINLDGLETRKGSKTFAWGGKYHANMNSRETLFTELGVLAEEPPRVPSGYADSEYVFLANTHPRVQLGMVQQLPKRRLTVADTMDLWINIAKSELLVLLRQVDGLVLNYDEAELLTGKANSVSAGRTILEMGPKFVVIKKGEHGALLVHKEGIAALPAYPTENVVDPTGAGDSFAGGMMGSIAAAKGAAPGSFESIRKALVHGTVVASYNIEAFSLERLTQIGRADLDKRYSEYAAMVRV